MHEPVVGALTGEDLLVNYEAHERSYKRVASEIGHKNARRLLRGWVKRD